MTTVVELHYTEMEGLCWPALLVLSACVIAKPEGQRRM